ncbi:hypothetical protein HBB16_19005 [Pseudonocardia sp. MCCB 268]|nr:hypothetical protein [Pseudonocardia cytotoxica]
MPVPRPAARAVPVHPGADVKRPTGFRRELGVVEEHRGPKSTGGRDSTVITVFRAGRRPAPQAERAERAGPSSVKWIERVGGRPGRDAGTLTGGELVLATDQVEPRPARDRPVRLRAGPPAGQARWYRRRRGRAPPRT